MNIQFTQLSLFEHQPSLDKYCSFDVIEVDSNLKTITHDVEVDGKIVKGIIKNRLEVNLSEKELSDLIASAIKIKRNVYGYEVFYEKDNRHYKLYTRFFNERTSTKETPKEFIHEGFKTWCK